VRTNLKQITFTGADDTVRPEELAALSGEFPFIEWGILVSQSQVGGHRFPSYEWIDRLIEVNEGLRSPMNLSMHVCGSWVRNLLLGKDEIPLRMDQFQRVQLNFHAERTPCDPEAFAESLKKIGNKQFIFQFDGAGGNKHMEAVQGQGINVAPLFDISGGRGILPEEWPEPLDVAYQGYAGGLGPDNLSEQLAKITNRAEGRDIWVDMETKLYGPGLQFNFHKCVACATAFGAFRASRN